MDPTLPYRYIPRKKQIKSNNQSINQQTYPIWFQLKQDSQRDVYENLPLLNEAGYARTQHRPKNV
jgi:hypothetical protein